MLSAYDEKGRLQCLVDRQIPTGKRFTCPVCQQEVLLRQGRRYRPHFAHKQLKDCVFYQENESAEHLNLKAVLYRALSQTEKVAVELVLLDLQQIADVMVNDKLILEVQCSPLPVSRLAERTIAYRQAGYQVLWLLGQKLWLKDRLTTLQRDFLYFSKNMGFYLWELDDEQGLLRLKYLIHEDLEGKVHYLSQSFALEDLTLGTFRKPFERQVSSSFIVQQNPDLLTYIQKQLYYKNQSWLARQAEAYQARENLLTKPLSAFYPQVRLPVAQGDFLQIESDLDAYYATFEAFYKHQTNQSVQVLHPPAYLEAWYGRKQANACDCRVL